MAEEKDFITEAEKLAYNTNTLSGTDVVAGDDEFLDPEGFQVGEQKATYVPADETNLNVTVPTKGTKLPLPPVEPMVVDGTEGKRKLIGGTELGEITETKKIGTVDDAESAVGTVGDKAIIQDEDVTGTVSDQSQVDAEAMQQELNPEATTQYQMGELMKSIEEGKPLPPWAAPSVRRISAIMQQRGMGSSSMASAAMMQAVMESGIPIATADAQAFANIQLKNLDGKQQAALQNAMVYAQMDTTNANNRTKAAVQNAQSFLTMDVENLRNDQAAQMASYEANTQAMFNDVAAENVTIQLNAKNEAQVDQFFAELGSQVEAANKNRVVAMRQFNVSEENAMNQFNTSLADARGKFNTNMKYAIEQSDTKWRRDINTANTATQNETNRINIQNLIGKQMAALQSLAQEYRDDAAYNFQKSESFLQKKHEVGMLAMEFANANKLYSKEQKDLVASKIGEWVANWVAYGGEGE
tara:strand:- start:774 stop:2183 length:1410 start_codon:yes stop_codon:yes gene_type:complete